MQCEILIFLNSQLLDHPKLWKVSRSNQNEGNSNGEKNKQKSALWKEVGIAGTCIKVKQRREPQGILWVSSGIFSILENGRRDLLQEGKYKAGQNVSDYRLWNT